MESLDLPHLQTLISQAKEEDLGPGDLSSAILVQPDERAVFRLIVKEPGVFAGQGVAPSVLKAYDSSIQIAWREAGADGTAIRSVPETVAEINGPLGSILSAERVLLNFLQRLCGIATHTRRFVDAIGGSEAIILDTRKTTPGWRGLEKYAVRCGGGSNHRFGLHDAVLIKDNHLAGVEVSRIAATIFEMLNKLSSQPGKADFVAVEVDTLQQLTEVFKVLGVDVVLLDNFTTQDMTRAVALREELGLTGKVSLEASGGITLDNVRTIAETGVDRISVGAITHSAPALDLSLERVAC